MTALARSQTFAFLSFPLEVQVHAISGLPAKDLLALASTCRALRAAAITASATVLELARSAPEVRIPLALLLLLEKDVGIDRVRERKSECTCLGCGAVSADGARVCEQCRDGSGVLGLAAAGDVAQELRAPILFICTRSNLVGRRIPRPSKQRDRRREGLIKMEAAVGSVPPENLLAVWRTLAASTVKAAEDSQDPQLLRHRRKLDLVAEAASLSGANASVDNDLVDLWVDHPPAHGRTLAIALVRRQVQRLQEVYETRAEKLPSIYNDTQIVADPNAGAGTMAELLADVATGTVPAVARLVFPTGKRDHLRPPELEFVMWGEDRRVEFEKYIQSRISNRSR